MCDVNTHCNTMAMKKPAAAKAEALSLRIPTELKAGLQKLADADRRKLGPYVQLVLEQHVVETAKGKKR